MLNKILLWLYMINSVLLINHEIDSAYWNEWDLFGMSGGITIFLILHFPILLLLFIGILQLMKKNISGFIISFLISILGICAFFIHLYFLYKGHTQFKTPVSMFILTSALIISIPQLIITVILLVNKTKKINKG